MINIATSICIDQNASDESLYFQLSYRNSEQRRIAYWKCAVVFFATSVKYNSGAKHLLFTNDEAPLKIKGIDIRDFLHKLGVEIRYLPFEHFIPPLGYSERYRNAFYKFDVIRKLGQEQKGSHLLLDADCVWTKTDPELFRMLQSGKLVLYNEFGQDEALNNRKYGFTRFGRKSLGETYRQLDPDYPTSVPMLFGGEIVGGTSKVLRELSTQLEEVFGKVISYPKEALPTIAWDPGRTDGTHEGILDGDENISSFVFNKMNNDWLNAKGHIRRIMTNIERPEAFQSDMNLPIWHLPHEKKQGFMPLFEAVINKKSAFWKVSAEQFNLYLGNYLGVPERRTKLEIYEYAVKRKVMALLFMANKYVHQFKNILKPV